MIASRGAGAPCGGNGELTRMRSDFLAGYCGRLHLARLHFASSSRTRSKGGKALECARFLGRPAGIFKSVAGCLVSRERSTQHNAHYSHAFVRCDLPHVVLRCSGPSLCRGQEAQDMKPSKPIPLWLTIDGLIIIVGMGLIALGIAIASSRILG